ncbi:galactokinase [Lobosporangium transversale]|uniref:Galactokinase n=1 Tax=Lobosporangium transversale TaxID=64571 RepID=A0A1Y2GQ42_9FUNG|nr:ribosomal protein S5 domain 2-type protein [Lobosporangium transversale]KAF9914326.1 galactokinase [Lobosporangium transversale]ORZ18419.1 ribosomal protein S5 domain 2-type protein [Lobosporangium transversale]|eukprot:XP_021882214.1 ribosomal protein S5 domain 2-type protein [Lobosporangium transversale]
MTSPIIPLIDDISILYSEPKLDAARARWADLVSQFEQLYGRVPDFIARSPGRVNLIGEHIDYAGFGVLPMAIENDCLIAVAVDHTNNKVQLANVNSKKYPTLEFTPKPRQEGYVSINPEEHVWSNYFSAGYRGILEELRIEQPKGMLCLMSGTVPTGAGLSSSSAFVCCAVNATVKAQESLLEKSKMPSAHELAIISIRSERYVGTMGGGMDQACSILSKPQSALFIEFHPVLKVTPVFFPTTQPPIAFVIANTMVTSDKAVTAPVRYNLRVVETRGAARILALALGIPIPASGKLHLKQVLDAHFENIGYQAAGKTEAEAEIEKLAEMTQIVERVLGTEEIRSGISFEKMCELADISKDEFTRLYIHQQIRADTFHLYRRAKHVYSEEKRVVQFRDTCEKSMKNQDLASETLFSQLGDLMNASQDSCHKLYDCSCDELEELTALARRAGAYGSRLTGAGWGGATISLITEDKVPAFIAYLKKEFYAKHYPDLGGAELDRAIFATAPSSGAATFVGRI